MVMPEVPARWLIPLEGLRPTAEEIMQCLRRGNLMDETFWSEDQLVKVMNSLRDSPGDRSLPPSRKALWMRVSLIPAHLVQRMARPLEKLTKGWALVGLALWGLVVPLLPLAREGFGFLETGDWLAAATLFLLGALLHELAHAAALSAQGYPAGEIGAGLLFVIPVLHNDVSAVALLSKKGKLRVDLAGISMQAAYGGMLILIATGSDIQTPALGFAARLTYGAVCWNLIPFIRADGYWALCDLLGFKDLDRVCDAGISRSKLIFKVVHRILNIIFLGLVAVVLPAIWAGRLANLWPWTTVVVPGLVILLWGAMARRIYKLIRALVVEWKFLQQK